MSLIFCQISKEKKFLVKKVIEEYLSSIFTIFSQKERENWIFFKKVGCVGILIEGETKKRGGKRLFLKTGGYWRKNFFNF